MAKQLVAVNTTKLPKWANGVIAVGSVALVGFVVYVIYKSLKKRSEQKDEVKTIDQTKADLKAWLNSGQKLTYANNLSVYNTTANTIQKLLDGMEASINTELDVIKNVIHCVKNQGDWLKLVEVFGTRSIVDANYITSTTYTLGDLLKDQLDTGGYVVQTTYEGFKYGGKWYTNSVDILNDYFRSKNIQW